MQLNGCEIRWQLSSVSCILKSHAWHARAKSVRDLIRIMSSLLDYATVVELLDQNRSILCDDLMFCLLCSVGIQCAAFYTAVPVRY